ncbi:MAG: heptosyltransferase-2 [Candidatus Omnitrophota bacterium]|jgi:heptosyltransferase-2
MFKPSSVQRILIIRTDRLGDCLMNIPLINRLRTNYPKALITVLTTKANRPLFQYHMSVNDLWTAEENDLQRWPGRIKLWKKMRGARFDLVVMTQSSKLFHTITFLAGIKYRLGFKRKWPFLLTHSIPDTKASSGAHEIDSNLKLLDLVCKLPWKRDLDLGFDMVNEYREIKHKIGIIEGKKHIVFHVTTTDPRKEMPLKVFKDTINLFLKKPRYRVFLVGVESNKKIEQELDIAPNPGFSNLLGQTNLVELGILLRESDCLISLDSGPMHLAWMLRLPVVGIFVSGLTGSNPKRWGIYKGFAPFKHLVAKAEELEADAIVHAAKDIIEEASALEDISH